MEFVDSNFILVLYFQYLGSSNMDHEKGPRVNP